jgi:hypothetical protein
MNRSCDEGQKTVDIGSETPATRAAETGPQYANQSCRSCMTNHDATMAVVFLKQDALLQCATLEWRQDIC